MRGKPKNIRRKAAAGKASAIEKSEISTKGDLAGFEELDLIENVHWLKFVSDDPEAQKGHLYTPDVLKREMEHLRHEVWAQFTNAVLENNVEFFQRCAAIVEWIKQDRPKPDPAGANILFVVSLIRHKAPKKSITSTAILRELDKWYPNRSGLMTEKDIRNVLAGLGYKCPINPDQLEIEDRAYVRRKYAEYFGKREGDT